MRFVETAEILRLSRTPLEIAGDCVPGVIGALLLIPTAGSLAPWLLGLAKVELVTHDFAPVAIQSMVGLAVLALACVPLLLLWDALTNTPLEFDRTHDAVRQGTHCLGRVSALCAVSVQEVDDAQWAVWVWSQTEAGRRQRVELAYHLPLDRAQALAQELAQRLGLPLGEPPS